MKISEILNENIFKSISKWIVDKVLKLFQTLKFGQEKKINLSDVSLSESFSINGVTLSEAPRNKGGNGRIAEYVCAYYLAEGLRQAGLRVETDVGKLQELSRIEISKHTNTLSDREIQSAIDAGNAMAKSMYESIINNGVDLVFTNYQFLPEQHSYDIEPTGAQQGKGSTDDMIIHIKKDDDKSAAHKILLSLKVSKDTKTSQGSKSPIPTLMKMFGSGGKGTKSDFIKLFGEKGKEFVDAIEKYNSIIRDEFWNSPEGLAYRKSKIDQGSDVKTYNANRPGGNQLRSSAAGNYYSAKIGTPSEHNLSKLFVELFNHGKVNLNQGDWRKFNEGFKQAIGFDDVITYKAICDKQGVSKVVSSATSKAYQEMYKALNNEIDVTLTAKPNSGSINVEVKYGDVVLRRLSCSVWKDGTIQFKFDSA